MRLRVILFGILMLVPCIEVAAQQQSQDFARLVGTFPIEDAAGKRIKFSGYIKTEGVTSGFASLWWRADRGEKAVAFDNMHDRAAAGTGNWRRYELSLSIPKDITNINFGVLLGGSGTAWFADLKIEIDKKPYASEQFDLSLTDSLRGFNARGEGYEFVSDPTQTYQGKPSLRIRRIR